MTSTSPYNKKEDLMTNKTKDEIVFSTLLKRGKFYDVYEGFDRTTNRKVAVKYFKKEKHTKFEKELKNEIVNLEILKHESLVEFISYLASPQNMENMIVCELCKWGNLYMAIGVHSGLPDDCLLALVQCVSGASAYLHGQDLVHRAISPENIFVHVDEHGRMLMKLGDLMYCVPDNQRTEIWVGNDSVFTHPEIYSKRIDKYQIKHDLWSIAITLYYTITNKNPVRMYDEQARSKSDWDTTHQRSYENRPRNKLCAQESSGLQKRFVWHGDFPQPHNLSKMLEMEMRALLVALMSEELSHTQFAAESLRILNYARVLAFLSLNGDLQTLYIAQPITYEKLNAAVRTCWSDEIKQVDSVVAASDCDCDCMLISQNTLLSRNQPRDSLVCTLPRVFRSDLDYKCFLSRILLVVPPENTDKTLRPLATPSFANSLENCDEYWKMSEAQPHRKMSSAGSGETENVQAARVKRHFASHRAHIHRVKCRYDWSLTQLYCFKQISCVFSRQILAAELSRLRATVHTETTICRVIEKMLGCKFFTPAIEESSKALREELEQRRDWITQLDGAIQYASEPVKQGSRMSEVIEQCANLHLDAESMNQLVFNSARLHNEVSMILAASSIDEMLMKFELIPRHEEMKKLTDSANCKCDLSCDMSRKLHNSFNETILINGHDKLRKMKSFRGAF